MSAAELTEGTRVRWVSDGTTFDGHVVAVNEGAPKPYLCRPTGAFHQWTTWLYADELEVVA